MAWSPNIRGQVEADFREAQRQRHAGAESADRQGPRARVRAASKSRPTPDDLVAGVIARRRIVRPS
jgi:hypothetical protein